MFPWEDPKAEAHVKARLPIMEIGAAPGIRRDLPRRRPADELPLSLQREDYGIVIMSHRGSSNGRLSVLLSSIPENYRVVVSTDSIDPTDVQRDAEVASYHGADIVHCTPWGGRAKNAIHCMQKTSWEITLFLCDDVWLFPETCMSALRWFITFERHYLPIASVCVPGWETYREHEKWGFSAWAQCLLEPWRFEAVPPNPQFMRGPSLYKNPFGACFVINREAYDDLGGFSPNYWAHDDVWNHKVWMSQKWVSAAYPGRGYMHLGAQSWHHGESQEYVREFKDATGMTGEESGELQLRSMNRWKKDLGHVFFNLGGTPAI